MSKIESESCFHFHLLLYFQRTKKRMLLTRACLFLPLIHQLYTQNQEEINWVRGPSCDYPARGTFYPEDNRTDEMM